MKKRAVTLLLILLLLCGCSSGASGPAASTAPTAAPSAVIADAPQTASPVPDASVSASPEISPDADKAEPTSAPAADAPTPSAQLPEASESPDPAVSESPEPSISVSAAPVPSESLPADTQAPASEPAHDPAPEPSEPAQTEPYSEKTADTILTVCGSALDREWYFTLSQLQSLGGYVQADYFSRGKDPKESTTTYIGIDLQYLFETVIGLEQYKKATFTASDGYAIGYSRSAVNMTYINEKDPSASLKMILAWNEGGAPCSLRLVMGQQTEGEYNRTNWVRSVTTIEVKAAA